MADTTPRTDDKEGRFIERLNVASKRGAPGSNSWHTEDGKYRSFGEAIRTSADMDMAILGRDGQREHLRTQAVKAAEGTPTHVANAISNIVTSFPSALTARAKDGRTHIWHVFGAAGAGKTFNSQLAITGLNNLSLFAATAQHQGYPSDRVKQDMAIGAKSLFEPIMRFSGIDTNNFDWKGYANDFYEGIQKSNASKDSVKLNRLSKTDDAYSDLLGLLSVQQVALQSGAASAADTSKVTPQTWAAGLDDLFSTAPKMDKGTYTRFINSLGNPGSPLALAIMTHNLDGEFSEKFLDTHRTEGTIDREGLGIKIGHRGADFDAAVASTNHNAVANANEMNLMANAYLGNQKDAQGNPLHQEEALRSKTAVNKGLDDRAANAHIRDSVIPVMDEFRAALGDDDLFHTAINTFSGKDGLSDAMHGYTDKNGKPMELTTSIASLLIDAGTDEEKAKNIADRMGKSSRDLKSLVGGDFSAGAPVNMDQAKANTGEGGFLAKLKAKKASGGPIAGPPPTAALTNNRPLNPISDELDKALVDGMKEVSVNPALQESRLTGHSNEKPTNYNDHGGVESTNASHICKVIKKSELNRDHIPVGAVPVGDSEKVTVISRDRLQNSRPIKQFSETVDAIMKYSNNKDDAKAIARDLAINLFGMGPEAKAVMIMKDLFHTNPASQVTHSGLEDVLADPNFRIGDIHNLTDDDYTKAAGMASAFVATGTAGNATGENVVKNTLMEMFSKLIKPGEANPTLDEKTDAALLNAAKLMHVVKDRDGLNKVREKLGNNVAAGNTAGAFNLLSNENFVKPDMDGNQKDMMNKYSSSMCGKGPQGIQSMADNAVSQHLGNTTNFGKGMNNSRILRGLGLA